MVRITASDLLSLGALIHECFHTFSSNVELLLSHLYVFCDSCEVRVSFLMDSHMFKGSKFQIQVRYCFKYLSSSYHSGKVAKMLFDVLPCLDEI